MGCLDNPSARRNVGQARRAAKSFDAKKCGFFDRAPPSVGAAYWKSLSRQGFRPLFRARRASARRGENPEKQGELRFVRRCSASLRAPRRERRRRADADFGHSVAVRLSVAPACVRRHFRTALRARMRQLARIRRVDPCLSSRGAYTDHEFVGVGHAREVTRGRSRRHPARTRLSRGVPAPGIRPIAFRSGARRCARTRRSGGGPGTDRSARRPRYRPD